MIYKEQFLKGAFGMKEYMTPDFDVTIYEIEDVITVSIGANDPNDDGNDWWG